MLQKKKGKIFSCLSPLTYLHSCAAMPELKWNEMSTIKMKGKGGKERERKISELYLCKRERERKKVTECML